MSMRSLLEPLPDAKKYNYLNMSSNTHKMDNYLKRDLEKAFNFLKEKNDPDHS